MSKARLTTFFERVFRKAVNLDSEFIEDFCVHHWSERYISKKFKQFTHISEEKQDMAVWRATSAGVWSVRTRATADSGQ